MPRSMIVNGKNGGTISALIIFRGRLTAGSNAWTQCIAPLPDSYSESIGADYRSIPMRTYAISDLKALGHEVIPFGSDKFVIV